MRATNSKQLACCALHFVSCQSQANLIIQVAPLEQSGEFFLFPFLLFSPSFRSPLSNPARRQLIKREIISIVSQAAMLWLLVRLPWGRQDDELFVEGALVVAVQIYLLLLLLLVVELRGGNSTRRSGSLRELLNDYLAAWRGIA